MTTEELKKLETELIEKRNQILSDLKNIARENPLIKGDFQANIKPSEHSDSYDEKANKVTEYETDHAIEQNLESQLEEINHTLNQIKAGSYGKCTNCHNDIPPQRLKVMPTAMSCVACAPKAKAL